MTFRETLNKARENKINVLDLSIAYECESAFDFEYTEQEFELLCNKARKVYASVGNEIDEVAIALAINDLIYCDKKTIADLVLLDIAEIEQRASYYM